MDAPPPPPPVEPPFFNPSDSESDDDLFTPSNADAYKLSAINETEDLFVPPPPENDSSESDSVSLEALPLATIPAKNDLVVTDMSTDAFLAEAKSNGAAPRSSIFSRAIPPKSPTSGAPLTIAEALPEKQTFASCMYNSYDDAAHQVEVGIYSVKRIIALARKLVVLEDEHYRSYQKALAHEQSKQDKIAQDGMDGFLKMYSVSKRLFNKLSAEHKVLSDNIQSRVLTPLMDFHHSAEARLKAINAEQHKIIAEMAQTRAQVNKCDKECRKLHVQAKLVLAEKNPEAKKEEKKEKSSFFSKMKHKITVATAGDPKKVLESLAVSAKIYQDAVRGANARLQQYVDHDLPHLFDSLQALECDRLNIANEKLEALHRIYQRGQTPMTAIVNEMTTSNAHFNVNNEIQHYLEEYLYKKGDPTPFVPFTYLLPCSPEDVRNGRLDAHPNSVFKTSLEACMMIQEKEFPRLDVPRIIPVLINAVKERQGLVTEGIFRVSHQREELVEMKKQFDQGIYDVNVDSPHAPAGLLKEWLRDLSEALIPTEVYSEVIRATKAAGDNPVPLNKVMEFYNRLEPINRNVIREIAVLSAEISSPENQKHNRMNMENLAIVFAPSFFRNPSEDPMEILHNTKYETKFTAAILAAVAHATNGLEVNIGSSRTMTDTVVRTETPQCPSTPSTNASVSMNSPPGSPPMSPTLVRTSFNAGMYFTPNNSTSNLSSPVASPIATQLAQSGPPPMLSQAQETQSTESKAVTQTSTVGSPAPPRLPPPISKSG